MLDLNVSIQTDEFGSIAEKSAISNMIKTDDWRSLVTGEIAHKQSNEFMEEGNENSSAKHERALVNMIEN